MKKIFYVIVVAMFVSFVPSQNTEIKNNTAEVNQVLGFYVFSDS